MQKAGGRGDIEKSAEREQRKMPNPTFATMVQKEEGGKERRGLKREKASTKKNAGGGGDILYRATG